MAQLTVNHLTLSNEEYKDIAFNLFDKNEGLHDKITPDYVKNMLVRERIGRFQTTEVFADMSVKYAYLLDNLH